MSQSRTIQSIIPEINNTILLPPIQREFVWDKAQIKRLFDSIMRDYPIGSFLFWNVREEDVESKIKYEFVQEYVEDKTFPDKLREFGGTHHNHKVDERYTELPENITLVLDGQQRLSAFYIGLRGSYIDRKRYTNKDDPSNYRRKKLYINLFNAPDSEGKLDTKYEFQFKEPEVSQTENNYWYEVGSILDVEDKYDERERMKKQIKADLGVSECPHERAVEENIERLYDAICEREVITYFEEETDDDDRILDVFVRANEAGTKLSKPDLLLSIASASWKETYPDIENDEEIVAREEIFDFVDKLNKHNVQASTNFDVRFVLQTLLACADEPISFSYENIDNQDRLKNMKRVWQDPEYKLAVESTLDLIDEFSLTLTYITKRSIIPIVYYIYTQSPALEWSSEQGQENRKNVLYFLVSSVINDVYASKSPQVTKLICRTIQETSRSRFSLQKIEESLNQYDKSIRFDESTIRNKFENYDYSSNKRTYLMLYILYFPAPANTNKTYEIDHIFPKKRLDEERLVEEDDIDYSTAHSISNQVDRIGNLQLVPKTVNRKKGDQPFPDWIQTRAEDFGSYLPNDEELYSIDNFNEFVEAREDLMIKTIKEEMVEEI